MPSLRAFLQEAPFTLALSAGFFGFFAHAGVLSALEDEGLLPARISGASAGALAGGIWASGVSAATLARELFSLRRQDFWDPAPGFGLLRGERFRARLRKVLSATTFEACRVPLLVSVFELGQRRTEVLREGELLSAIHASCALPVLFQPVRLASRLYVDGGVLDRPALAGVQAGERVLLHHLPSQSPWRRFYGPAQHPGAAPLRATVATRGLPRVGPFSLPVGERAFEASRAAFRDALDRPYDAT